VTFRAVGVLFVHEVMPMQPVGRQTMEDVLGVAAKISVGKESCTIVG
jgi:hypothetical protein